MEGHVKTESEDSMGGSEAVTPKLEEPPTDLGKPDRSASVTGEIEQLPPLPEETLLSPDVISPSLKVASTEKQKKTIVGGSETSKPLDDEQLLFDMLDNKEGSTEVSHDVSKEPQSQDDQNIGDTVKKATIDQHEADRTEKSEGADDILAELDELDVILDAEEEEEEEGEGEEEKEVWGAKLKEPDPGGKEEKKLDGAKLDTVDTVDGGEVEENQEIDRPRHEESETPPSPNEVESENEPPGEVRDSPPGAEPTSDLKSRPPVTTIEVTDDHKLEPSTAIEFAVPSQIQVEHVESRPEGEPPMMEEIKTVTPVPPLVEHELQVEPGVEPVPANIGSEQPDIGHEPQESNPESSKAECKPPDLHPGQPKIENESQIEQREDKFEHTLEDQVEPLEGEPEKPELTVKEEPSEVLEEAVNTNAEPTHSSQESEITFYHKEPPETNSKSADTEGLSQTSIHESSGEAKQSIADLTEQDGNSDSDRRIAEDSPKKSEGESIRSEGESDQVVTEDEKAKCEQSLKKEDSIQESDER
jgi:hypothetical protein